MRVSEVLNELFTHPYPYKWIGSDQIAFKTENGDTIKVDIVKFNDGVLNVSFERNGAYDLTGGGDSFRIMATVIMILTEWIHRVKPPIIMFTSETDEPSRVQLYQRLTQKLLRNFDYTNISGKGSLLADVNLGKIMNQLFRDYMPEKRVFLLARNDLLKPITEAPIPADWDAQAVAVRPGTTFQSRLAYAKQRAQKVGAGSSRVAFVIDYEGRPTVLKIAKNRKGLAQNVEEATILNDGYFKQIGILIPIIDFDTGQNVSWIHTELAKPYTMDAQLTDALGIDMRSMLELVDTYAGKFRRSRFASAAQAKETLLYHVDPDRRDDVVDMAEKLYDIKSGTSMNLIDLVHPGNWGEYQGRPVIIDAGFAGSAVPLYKF